MTRCCHIMCGMIDGTKYKNEGSHFIMPNAVMFITFKLKEGASVPDFLRTSERLYDEVFSKEKGCISWKQLIDGETWADLLIWETMDDAKNSMDASETNSLVIEFCSFIDQESVKHHLFSVEKSYQVDLRPQPK